MGIFKLRGIQIHK